MATISHNSDEKALSNSNPHLEYAENEKHELAGAVIVPGEVHLEEIHRMTPEEKSEALAAAQALDSGLPPFSMRGAYFFMTLAVVFLCGGDNGLDSAIMSSINSMTTWQTYFNQEEAAKSTGIIFGIYTVGGVSSFPLSATLPDKIGRRKAMFVGNTILIAGALLTALATNLPMFLAGRYLTGLGAASAAQAAKSYVAELSGPKYRGFALGTYNTMFTIGSIIASGISIPTGKLTTEWSWRIPCFVQVIFPFINIAAILFCPESPRWLYSRGRKDEAAKVLAMFHSQDNDINSPLVQLELREIEEDISLTGADKRWWDFKVLFKNRANRYRMCLAVLMSAFGQLAGPSGAYFTVLLKVAGINDGMKQRELNLVNSVTTFCGALFGASIIDRTGRRPLLVGCTIWISLCMFAIGACLSHQDQLAAATAGIVFIFLFGALGQIAWTPCNAIYVPEILSFEMRGKGLAFQAIFTQSFGLINTFAVPAALIALTWKLYIIFAIWDAFGATMIYFFVVETKGIPLEQMEEIFEAKVPRKKADSIVKAKSEAERAERKAKKEGGRA